MKKTFLLLGIFVLFLGLIIFVIMFFVKASQGKGALQVTSTPESKIYLNGKYIGQTPYPRVDGQNTFLTGDYTLRLVPLNTLFPEYQEKVSINKLTLTVVEHTFGPQGKGNGSIISLSPISSKTDAQLLVLSLPDNANVTLDGNSMGMTPLLLKNQTASDHKISVKKDGYKEKIVPIKTPLGFKVQVLVDLGIGQDPVASPTPTIPLPTPTVQAASTSATLTINSTPTGFLRVRSTNSVGGTEVGRVSPGETYTILQELDSWYRIKLSTGVEGWISGDFVTKNQ
jgi:septal ring-binding cell division protein DamX